MKRFTHRSLMIATLTATTFWHNPWARAQDTTVPQLPGVDVIAEPDAPASRTPQAVQEALFPQQQPSVGADIPSILDSTIFSSPPADGYSAASATVGGRIDIPLIDFPGSIDVVTEDVIRDQVALEFNDVLRDISSAVKLGDSLRPDAFLLRGFEVRARDFRRNGFADPVPSPRDLAGIERIEVLKGPASILYGSGQPSGVVNFITKKASRYAQTSAEYTFGGFDLNRTVFDSTGTLATNEEMYYRVTAAHQDAGSFRDEGFNERTYVSPDITWVLDDQTTLTWEGEYQHDRSRFDSGVLAINGDPSFLPNDRFLNGPDDRQLFEDYRNTLLLTHQIDDYWSWQVGVYDTWYRNPTTATVPLDVSGGFAPVPTSPVVFRQDRLVDPFEEEYHSVIANLAGEFETGAWTHRVVFGTEQGWFIANDFRGTQGDISIFDASSGTVLGVIPQAPLIYDADFTQNRHGFYVQDVVELSEYLSVLSGVRYDHVKQKFDRNVFGLPVRNDDEFDQVTPKVGVVLQPIPDLLSFYATYSESFDPPPGGVRFDPRPLVPETGQIAEGGVKMQLLENLHATVAGFHILKQNVVFDNFATFTTSQVGEIRNQGAEIELQGRVSQRMNVIANYAYIDSEITEDEITTRIGEPFRNVPMHNANLWTRYDLIQQQDQTFGTALGLIYVGDRSGDIDNNFTLPSFTRWDAGLYYRLGRFDASLYFENIFDTEYFTGSESGYSVFVGAPSNVRASLAMTW